jgi:hypothetical protein
MACLRLLPCVRNSSRELSSSDRRPRWDARSTSQVKLANLADPAMARFLTVLGLAILVVGLLWPQLSRIGLGRLPGDIVIERQLTFRALADGRFSGLRR